MKKLLIQDFKIELTFKIIIFINKKNKKNKKNTNFELEKYYKNKYLYTIYYLNYIINNI